MTLDVFKQCFESRSFLPELQTGDRDQVHLSFDPPREADTPKTAGPPPGESWDAGRLQFDPAMKHFMNGWRSEAPELDEPARTQWRRAHGEFMAHVLQRVATSPLCESLVLRGSSAMPFWVGNLAREPKDIDFVVVPPSVDIRSAEAGRIRERLREQVEQQAPSGITVMSDATALSEIWTYDRVPGERLVFTWRCGDFPWAHTQIDLVYREQLPEPPRRLPELGVLAAGPELSLAWKILWLWGDMHPRAKDLYDAMVLAERYSLSEELLRRVFGDEIRARRFLDLTKIDNDQLEWVGMQQRSPWTDSSRALARSWWERLRAAAPRLADPTPLK
ncbi:MAG: nucleotidyl transferase AbiEii/AbiGii toxin family protein [Myxococcota bacterium]